MGDSCRSGAVEWIELVFGDCVYNYRDLLGFSIGLASIGCWLLAQVPQLYKNYRSQSAEALSAWFLAEWLLGDTFNLVGSLLKGDQPQSVVLTAQYFVCMDAVMLIQYLYYQSLAHRRERIAAPRRHRRHHHRHHHHHHHSTVAGSSEQQQQQQQAGAEGGGHACEIVTDGGVAPASAAAAGAAGGSRDVSFRPQRALAPLAAAAVMVAQVPRLQRLGAAAGRSGAARRLLAFSSSPELGLAARMPPWAHAAGTVLGYASSLLYLASRVSQIYRNWARRSVEGLAMSMFLFAIAANTCYGASLLIRTYTLEQLVGSLPWLLGSLGTVALDLTILMQSRMLGDGGGSKKRESDEEESLLGEDKPRSPRGAGHHHALHHLGASGGGGSSSAAAPY